MGRFNFTNAKDLENLKAEVEKLYASVGEAHCPYFKGKIVFNSVGLRHMKFKSDQVARSHSEQYARLKLFYLAPQVLALSRTVQGISQTKHFERIRIHSRTDTVLKEVSYYEFIAVLEKVRVKVIVKQVDGGQKFFWSIIPYWKIDSVNSRRILSSGNPEED